MKQTKKQPSQKARQAWQHSLNMSEGKQHAKWFLYGALFAITCIIGLFAL